MKSFLLSLIIIFSLLSNTNAGVYSTPGTGVNWNLDDLVSNSGGFLTVQPGFYQVNDTIRISTGDILNITTDVTVKFLFNTSIIVLGRIMIDPPSGVLFTAVNTTTGFLGMRLDNSAGSIIRKLTLEYAVSLRLSDSSPTIDSCIFQYNNNNVSTTFGNGAIALFRSNPLITNSKFLNNQRAAIQGGSNISNAPKIMNCLFLGNNTTNQNVPQINLGATSSAGEDTVKIINNQILRASTNSGGIGFLPIGNVYAVISGNIIMNNRYGMTFNGGSNINAIVSYNQVDSNNTQNNPALGGSGIAFSGGSASSHQNTVVRDNLFRWNLWGITIQGGSKPNLGDLTNLDANDDGNNVFIGNTNLTTPGIDLYNNSVENIMAQNNYWGTNDPAEIENKIFHQPDNASLGLVNYSLFVVPLTLETFSASVLNDAIKISWQTKNEINSAYFELEKSMDGRQFSTLGVIIAIGNSVGSSYHFTDANTRVTDENFYRLKMFDKNGQFAYSGILRVSIKNAKNDIVVYPTQLNGNNRITAKIQSLSYQDLSIKLVDASGKTLYNLTLPVMAGSSLQSISLPTNLPSGLLFLQVSGADLKHVIPISNF